ncbi:Hypothetical predicted protein [Olea europaea subsp. europaea]|uniref:Uncharacterized protein n=1 Tax=Olea europaea subsp. europaea TaxID=158383 RepID=A0A8S0QW18_OLEEU|nr:Hypothetical predicted protein [Olea europaea subsp. europaea]
MINTESNGNGMAVGETASDANDKQLPAALKKTALRELQNENVRSINKQRESSPFGGGRPSGNAIKVCGTKRLTPERPSSSSHLYMACNGANENVMNARRRFEFELGRGRLQDMEKYSDSPQLRNMSQMLQEIPQKETHMKEKHIHLIPVASKNQIAPMMTFSSGGPSVPSSLGKRSNVSQAPGSDNPKVSSDLPHKIDLKRTNEQLRTDRFIQLHKILEHLEKTNPKEYIQKLLNLSPAELSKHAVELEKRAIQLALEEGKEMQWMNALNILRRSGK